MNEPITVQQWAAMLCKGTLHEFGHFLDSVLGVPSESCFFYEAEFRGAKYILKSLKTTWFDEALSSAIKKIEKVYITFFVGILGFVFLTSFGVLREWNEIAILGLALGWLILDCLIISPLIYLPFMPKPIRKHIKEIDKLTPYEQKVRDAELGRNERVEKMMKKYKNSGRYLGN